MTSDQLEKAMCEMVKETIRIIRIKRRDFSVETKPDYNGLVDADIVTSVDRQAQAIYTRLFAEKFPGFGAIHEEDGQKIACTLGTLTAPFWPVPIEEAIFTDDPVDGTRRLAEGANYGIASMLGLLINGEGAAAAVGDVNNGHIICAQPSGKVTQYLEHRTYDLNSIKREARLSAGPVLLRDEIDQYTPFMQRVIISGVLGQVSQTKNDSIGTTHALLWLDYATSLAIRPSGSDTPWDCVPVSVIGTKLDFVWLRVDDTRERFLECAAPLPRTITRRGYGSLVVHRSHIPQLREHFEVKLLS